MNETDQQLLDRYFQDRASDGDIAALQQRLLDDADLRQLYLQEAMCETDLRSIALRGEDGSAEPTSAEPRKAWAPLMLLTSVAAVAIAVAVLSVISQGERRVQTVGQILSSELAGWQSDQPTIVGAEFAPGTYLLQRGVATLGFHSGAEMVLEGPAQIEVVSEMQVIFDYGNASFHVPESAIGFQVDTRYGRIVDHGTRFSLSLGQQGREARLAVREGEIAIHHANGDVQHLYDDETARVDEKQIQADNDPAAEGGLDTREPVVTLGTRGRETSIIYKDGLRQSKLSPDFLMVKYTGPENAVNRRSLLAFDLSGIDLDQVAEARLILNAVPTGLGLVTDMPKVSEFGLYGIPDDDREHWTTSKLRWSDAPKVEEATRLATFSMPRAEQRAVVTLDTPELLAFLQADQSGEVGFLLHCDTPGGTLVHGFASSQHREAAGPVLEMVMKEAVQN